MNDLSNKDEMMAYLAAQGRKHAEIADALGLSKDTVRLKLADERMQFEVKHLRYKLHGKDHKKRFQEILPHAIDVTENILLDPNAKQATRFAAAQEVMDRALGKPKQTVEHEGSLMRALIEKLEGKSGDASPTQLPPARILENPNEKAPSKKQGNPNLDTVDKWVTENL